MCSHESGLSDDVMFDDAGSLVVDLDGLSWELCGILGGVYFVGCGYFRSSSESDKVTMKVKVKI